MRMVALLVVVMLGGCVTSPEEDPVQIRMNGIDERVQRIERVVSNQSLLQLAQRLDAVQADLRTISGRIEELENAAEALKKQQRNLYADIDERIKAMPSLATPGGSAGAPGGAAEQTAYAQAFDALKASNYPAAITGFKQFLATYPTGGLADNAQYWLGEAYYVTRDYPNALASFQEVLSRWPDSRKAPDALLKVGFTQQEMKRTDAARATLTEVTQRYPDTEAAKLAAERLRRLRASR
jgi:tol-pal system protein YbgF